MRLRTDDGQNINKDDRVSESYTTVRVLQN